jgi:DNA-binding HxlR family transcriptional regulator
MALERVRDEVRPYVLPTTAAKSCPIAASMGVFGRKWALVVLRDIAFRTEPRFSDILRWNKGLTPRVLSWRVQELEAEGLVVRVPGEDKREVRYELTPKGRDAIPILASLIFFGAKHLADEVFADGKPRSMTTMFPDGQRELLQGMADWAARRS